MAQWQCPQCAFPFCAQVAQKCTNCGWVVGTPVTPSAVAPTPKLSSPADLHRAVNDTTRSASERAAAALEIAQRNV
jgi:hypothetical protein